MTTVRLSPRARQQLNTILDYLEHRSGPPIADQHLHKFRKLFDRLSQTPNIGANRSELGKGIKLSMVTRYLIYHRYHVDRDEVEIAIIRDGSRRTVKPSDF